MPGDQREHPIDERTHRLLVKTAHALIAIVGIIAFVVSSYYLRRYAINTGMPEWLAWTLFIALDAGGIAGTLCWLLATGPARTQGKILAMANLTVSVIGNILGHLIEAKMMPVTPILVILTGAVYPIELWALVHLGIQLRTQHPVEPEQHTARVATTERIPEPTTAQRTATTVPAELPRTPLPPAALSSPPASSPPTAPPTPRIPPAVAGTRPTVTPPPRRRGRGRNLTPAAEARIRDLWNQGLPVQEVMTRSGYGRTVVYDIRKTMNEAERGNRQRERVA